MFALAGAYGALALLGLRWSSAHAAGSPVWPAAGVALAVLVLAGTRYWPGIVLGYLAAAAVNHSAHPAWVVVTIAMANALATVAGARLLSRTRFNARIETFSDFLLFIVAGAVTGLIGATVGMLAIGQAHGLDATSIRLGWVQWWLGDIVGVLVVGSVVLAWARAGLARPVRWWLELGVCLALLAFIGMFVFFSDGQRTYAFVVYCPLMWASLSLRLRGATLACLLLAGIALWSTTLGLGPFGTAAPHARYLDLQMFLAVSTVSTVVLAVFADERRAQRALVLSEARLRLALDASNTGLWKIDLRTGAMAFSPECAQITGLGPGDVQPTRAGIVELLDAADVPRVRAAFLSALERQALFESEFRIQRPDGTTLWLEARGRAMADADGRPSTMVGTITDVTGRRGDQRRLAEQARLLDLTSDAILIRHLDGRIHYWNDGSVRLYGYTREEAIDRNAAELLRTEFPMPLREITRELLVSDRWDGDLLHYRKDGEPRVIHSRWVLTRDAAGRPQSVMQTNTDVTEQKRAAAAAAFLAEVDRRVAQATSADEVAATGLRLLGEHLGLMRCTLSDIDLENARVRTLHEWTDRAPRVSGSFDAREFFTSDFGLRLASGEAVAIRDLRTDPLTAPFALNYLPFGTVALAAASYVIEGRIAGTLTASASTPRAWRDDELHLLREVIGRLWPAIERAKSIAAVRESEARFRQLADTAPMMIWVAESDGRCSYVSRRWTEFTGRLPEAELDFGWKEVVHPDDLAGYAAAFDEAAHDYRAFAAEYRALRWDGAYRWLHVTARPRFGAGSEFLGYIGALMDVTERRQAEEALREADRRKDEFLATLAHELRNPLSPVRTGLHVLDLTDDADTARRTRRMMERQLGHMVRLIDDLLDVSRITSGKVVLQRDRIALQDAARAAVESARPQLEAARHRLHVQMRDAPLWVDADATRVAQVIGNLLTNAAKYTPDGGDITLRVEPGDGVACVVVTDTGLGIPPDALGEVFGMFAQVNRTLDRAQGGLGIGLALARRLVEMHGGSIEAASAGLGRGSTFTVRLPLAVDVGDVPSLEAQPPPAAESVPRRRVLVVDDNQDAAATLAMMLELEGHDARAAFGGAEGLRIAEAWRPEVAFLDLGMPGMDGFELARRMRALPGGDAVLIVAVSGWAGERDKRQSAEAGFDLHLTKPVSVEAVQAAVVRGADAVVPAA
ncbi:PAS domain S-box protein [Cognatilysobacter segetis]|uniref:PAS domain S-box protein n=1 Tax=Cognatilysobacter segetis TaxID=2492394 RepID=UPI00138FEFC3|nr:PAS domain S-box protein [Lysobacter segetis]